MSHSEKRLNMYTKYRIHKTYLVKMTAKSKKTEGTKILYRVTLKTKVDLGTMMLKVVTGEV